jgi:hypothetical protein
MFKELTTEEIEVRVWATIVLVLASILLISVVCILFAVMFVDQNMDKIAPIDKPPSWRWHRRVNWLN